MGKVYPCFQQFKNNTFLVGTYPFLTYIRKYNLQAVFIPFIQTAPLQFYECSCLMSLVIKLEKINNLVSDLSIVDFDCIAQSTSAINAHSYQMPASNLKYNCRDEGYKLHATRYFFKYAGPITSFFPP